MHGASVLVRGQLVGVDSLSVFLGHGTHGGRLNSRHLSLLAGPPGPKICFDSRCYKVLEAEWIHCWPLN